MAEDQSTEEPEWMQLAWQLAGEIRQRRRAAGLSQPQLANRIGYTKQYVSLAERPQRGLPSASLVQAIDEALDADGVLVALHDQADEARKACRPGALPRTMAADAPTREATSGRELGTTSTPADPEEVENAKRRELIASAAAIAFGDSLDEPVARILAAADEPQVPARVRTGDLVHLRSTIVALAAENSRVGARPVRHQALAALRWATALQESSSTPAIRRELSVLTAKLADLAAWITFDCGQYEPARQLSLLGLQAARESTDLGMRAWIASGLARQELYRGNWASGLEMTQLAFTASDALTPNAIADLHTVKALAYARKQDTAACFRCLGTATDTYRPDSVASEPPWLLDFTPARFERNLAFARYYLLLGGADVGDRAAHRLALIENFSKAFHQYPADAVLNKAIIATRLATLLYQEGEQHTAHQTTEDAITLAEQVRSTLLADDLRVLLRRLPTGEKSDEYTHNIRRHVSLTLTEMT